MRKLTSRVDEQVLAEGRDKSIDTLTDLDLEKELFQIVPLNVTQSDKDYIHQHIVRFRTLFKSIPPAKANAALLDIGGRGNLMPPYFNRLGYKFVAIANKWLSRDLDTDRIAQFIPRENFRCDYFDAESDPFPYVDDSFETVVCSEVIEHLKYDPAHMLEEANRVLKIGGKLVLTTPNITSATALYRLLSGVHPQTWSVYTGKDADRHNREYAPREIVRLLEACGFGDVVIDTFSLEPTPMRIRLITAWASFPWLVCGQLGSFKDRGEFILAVGTKNGVTRDRYPRWLYDQNE
jgi:2-polyprenyl-3-methyl-5-hydroxy-6-metoxy-1,4-benzoquinol methylase